MDDGKGQGADPFGETADPRLYVPRAACEAALDALVGSLSGGRDCVALTGPPGIGKTLLLHRCAAQLARRWQTAYLAYGALGIDDVCRWSLGLLGETLLGDARSQLLDVARRSSKRGWGILLLVDEIDSLHPDTGRALAALTEEAGGSIAVALAGIEAAATARALSAFGPELREVRLSQPMSGAEVEDYLLTRLRLAGAGPEVRDRFGERTVHRIHHLSGGIPRRIHDIARTICERPPSDVNISALADCWLGAPLDELGADLEA